ncbi:MAG: ClpXP protease specificity-enhancing factor [Dechloromonas sp.]|uniref:ClpXP protease specificity-enhancing factor n=1 Tax=Candidatus Dechloromonas phosphorivorans TaxID=2899244 RepID=A0A9D7LNJ5_9RHOO|nr:ClpXP protease specificity-enhancing factor [Candidatus Dechloromonas phosphorivorans]
MDLPSTKPYLLRAIWEWCGDNGFTPYIAVQIDARTRVPREFVRDGQIVLNIGPDASNKLQIGNEFIEFQARFGGVARQLSVPVEQVTAIYARENGSGMAFEIEPAATVAEGGVSEDVHQASSDDTPEPPRPEGGPPRLQRIK